MVIGITGGVGCGKSTVLEILRKEYQAKILIADEIGHTAMLPGNIAYDEICTVFGDGILLPDKTVNRTVLAEIVYADDEKLGQLNHIIHPYVFRVIRQKLKEWEKQPLIIIETAILFETGCDALCQEVWGVVTPREVRIRRLIESRGYSVKKAEDIMSKQLSDEELTRRCDKIVHNDGTLLDLQIQLKQLLGIS